VDINLIIGPSHMMLLSHISVDYPCHCHHYIFQVESLHSNSRIPKGMSRRSLTFENSKNQD